MLLAHALEWLVPAGGAQQREALELVLLVEQVPPEDLEQLLRRGEGGEHEEHEPALGALAAPRGAAQRRVQAEDRVAAGERPVVGVRRAKARAIASSDAGRRTEKAPTGACSSSRASIEQPLHPQALAELVVHLDAVPAQVPRRGGALVGHRDGVVAVQAGAQQRRGGHDRRHRYVAVQRSGLVQPPQLRIELPPRHQPWQARRGDGPGDRGSVPDREQRTVEAGAAHDLDRHGRVLATPHRNQHPSRLRPRAPGPSGGPGDVPRPRPRSVAAGGGRGGWCRRTLRDPPSRAPPAAPPPRPAAARPRTPPEAARPA